MRLFYPPAIPTLPEQLAEIFHPTVDRAILTRFRPLPTVSASLTTCGSSEGVSTVHSLNEAMSAARAMESFESAKPDSMIGIRAAAARRRLISGAEGGICFDMLTF
jgi:hypothetical protein